MTDLSRAAQLNVQQLVTFRRVYELGGYAPAAAETGSSVTTVWQHIRAIERSYGVQFFKKVGRGVKATAEAERLYAVVDQLLVNLESTFDIVNESATTTTPIRIVAGNRMMIEDLAEPLAKFQSENAKQLVIRNGNNRRAEELIMGDKADIGLSLEPGPQRKSNKIHYEPGYFVDFLAVAPRDHPYAKTRSQSLRELIKHPLIVTHPGTHGREALEQALHRERLDATIAVETDNSGFTIACVQAGMGVGILAGRPDGRMCQSLSTRSLRRQLGRRQIVLMWLKGRSLTNPMVEVIESIKRFHTG